MINPSNKTTKNCVFCKAEFTRAKTEYIVRWEKRNYCSRECSYKDRKNKVSPKKGKPSGIIPWNKGKKGLQVAWNKGIHYEQVANEKNYLWKGDEASLEAKHQWVKRKLGKPQRCDHCGTTEDRMYHWANISGKYKRDLSDWKRLCVPCHKKYDLDKINNGSIIIKT